MTPHKNETWTQQNQDAMIRSYERMIKKFEEAKNPKWIVIHQDERL